MNESLREYVNALLKMLEDAGDKGLPLEKVDEKMISHLGGRIKDKQDLIPEEALKLALDEWLAIKIIDYDDNADLVWYVKALSGGESKRFRGLSGAQQAMLKMLYDCNEGFQVGAMKSDEAIRRLNELGFDVEDVPTIPRIISEARVPGNDGMQWWVYVIPQYELSEEFKALQQESLEKARRIDERMMRGKD